MKTPHLSKCNLFSQAKTRDFDALEYERKFMLNTAANRVARSDRRLPNGNIIFQTIASWLSLRDSTWQTIPAVISFNLQSHWPHWILYFFGQVLKPNFLICKDISHIRRIKLFLLRKNNHKRSQILALRPLSFFFYYGALLQYWILWVSGLDCGLNFTVTTVVTIN